ncbi:MAG TPA: hypothetical protein VIA18_32190, partial [Polyangia bacterium]|nr:hypothetical protein [Polyangia bacterium]
GACAAGVQTCIGSLGACNGSVLPAAEENCFNNVDDDCNGVVNNGCPVSVTTGTPVLLTTRGSGSGTTFSARCPAGTFVGKVKMAGDQTDSGYVSGIALYCETPTLTANDAAMTYTLTEALDTTPTVSVDGTVEDTTFAAIGCANANGIGWETNGYYDSTGIDGNAITCTNLTSQLSSTNQLTFLYTADSASTPNGWHASGVTTTYNDACASGSVLIGYDGKKSRWITSMAAVCAPLVVNYQ